MVGARGAATCIREGNIMRRNKPKKLELRQRKVDRPDPIEELRQLKEEELKRAAGGMMCDVIGNACC